MEQAMTTRFDIMYTSHFSFVFINKHRETLLRAPRCFFYSLRTNASMRSSAWVMCLTE